MKIEIVFWKIRSQTLRFYFEDTNAVIGLDYFKSKHTCNYQHS